ncbi:MAG: acyltransferase [Prevotella sp.]
MKTTTHRSHIVWLDVIRLVAMLMVIGVHCIDPFYISPTLGSLPQYKHWAAIYGSLLRPSVPLFVMMTGLLLLPVQGMTMREFYKKRITRILWPMLIWSVLYNMFPWFTGVIGLPKEIIGDFFCYVQGNESQALADSLKDTAMIPFQFSFKENHMWYMYLLIGMYLYMPFFSAWIEKYGRNAERTFLVIWAVSLFIPYGRAYISNYILGEATWNEFGTLYYFAGFSGYLVLGHYLKEGNSWSIGKTAVVSTLLFAAGYAVTYTGFSNATADPSATEQDMELYFTFCSPNVVLMTAAAFLIMQKIKISGKGLRNALATMPKYGFGIYIVHYFLVGPAFILIGMLSLPIPLQVPVMTLLIFAGAYIITWAMYRLLGKKAKYIMG